MPEVSRPVQVPARRTTTMAETDAPAQTVPPSATTGQAPKTVQKKKPGPKPKTQAKTAHPKKVETKKDPKPSMAVVPRARPVHRAVVPSTKVEVILPAQASPATSPLALPQEFNPASTAMMDRDAVYFGGQGLGSQPFTPEQTQVLLTPAADAELDILPTGEVYMSG